MKDHGADVGWYDVEVVIADGMISEFLVNPADGTVKATSTEDKTITKAMVTADAVDAAKAAAKATNTCHSRSVRIGGAIALPMFDVRFDDENTDR